MSSNILGVGLPYAVNPSQNKPINSSAETGQIKSFSELLHSKLAEANDLQKEADRLTERFLVGENVEIHQLMLTMEKADIALRQMVEIRNKLIEAYKEISHMQV